MVDAYEIGLRLVRQGELGLILAGFQHDLAAIDRAVAASGPPLEGLPQVQRGVAIASLAADRRVAARLVTADGAVLEAERVGAEAGSDAAAGATVGQAVEASPFDEAGEPVRGRAGPVLERSASGRTGAAPAAVAPAEVKAGRELERSAADEAMAQSVRVVITRPEGAAPFAGVDTIGSEPGRQSTGLEAPDPVVRPERSVAPVGTGGVRIAGAPGESEAVPRVGADIAGLLQERRPGAISSDGQERVAALRQMLSIDGGARQVGRESAPADGAGQGSMPGGMERAPEPGGAAPGLFMDRSAAPDADSGGGGGSMTGSVMLDGRLVGHWLSEAMAREASRPGAGPTFFDARQAPAWTPSGVV